ncbi:coat F domain-containing protein [Natranaerovirga hydrolytica]|uniref:Coat F domain-containing protein n=1 Tax=Natranaerovirga hydrolytica TaxID=680378 RepID=A0A4R1MYW3_9FIRM|nr:spore coat protein [Natranaerovirga hydrolytica]TCK98345.1 coat F domain-containing protein [Natranaerovirga hydrolytica]
MQEKDMVSDALNQLKSSLTNYSTAISECDNPQLRQTLQQIRNQCEQSQFELYQMAKTKNYYEPASQANPQEIQQIRSQHQGQGMS